PHPQPRTPPLTPTPGTPGSGSPPPGVTDPHPAGVADPHPAGVADAHPPGTPDPHPPGAPEPHAPGSGAPEREGNPGAEHVVPVVHTLPRPAVPEPVRAAAAAPGPRLAERPVVALVLGSGLGGLADEVEDATWVPAAEVPGMPVPKVPGHAGAVVAGRLAGVPVLVLAGRVHTYEGYSATEVAFATRVAAEVGCRALIATNAAGGLNLDYNPADLMVLTDHISFLFDNPLRGAPDFVDLAGAYSPDLRAAAVE